MKANNSRSMPGMFSTHYELIYVFEQGTRVGYRQQCLEIHPNEAWAERFMASIDPRLRYKDPTFVFPFLFSCTIHLFTVTSI